MLIDEHLIRDIISQEREEGQEITKDTNAHDLPFLHRLSNFEGSRRINPRILLNELSKESEKYAYALRALRG